MGKDPKIMSPEFRLTSEMIDAMGGKKYVLQRLSELLLSCL